MSDPDNSTASNDRPQSMQLATRSVLPCQPLNRVSTDDKQIFGGIIDVIDEYDSYRILIKHGLLDRNYSTSQLNFLRIHINLGISNPPLTSFVTLHYCAAV